MKKHSLVIMLLGMVAFHCSAQEIEVEKVFGGYKYTQDGEMLRFGELVDILETNEQAYPLIKSARTSNTLSSILGAAGGFLIGLPLGTALGGGEPNWSLAAIGGGLVVISIPISSSGNKKAKQAIDIYNAQLWSGSTSKLQPRFAFSARGTGIGLTMHF